MLGPEHVFRLSLCPCTCLPSLSYHREAFFLVSLSGGVCVCAHTHVHAVQFKVRVLTEVHVYHASWLLALVPTGFCFVLQITGWIAMGLSSSWAASPSSLKRFSGLPMAYPTPSTLQTISACSPASAWKSLPHEGPRERAHWMDDCKGPCCGNFCPSPHFLLPVVRLSPGLSTFSACGPCPASTSSPSCATC